MAVAVIFSTKERTELYLKWLARQCASAAVKEFMQTIVAKAIEENESGLWSIDLKKLTASVEASFYNDADSIDGKIAIPETTTTFAGRWCPINRWFVVPGATIAAIVEHYVRDDEFFLQLIAGNVAIFGDSDSPIQYLHCHAVNDRNQVEWAIEGLLFACYFVKLP